MADFNTPTNTTTYTSVLTILNEKIANAARALFTGDTNLPAGTLQYNRTNRVFEEWSGATWVEMRVEPAGIIKAFGGATAPRGHLLCNGASVLANSYKALFDAIGNTYGGNGSNVGGVYSGSFNVPNLQGRFPLGKATAGTGSVLAGTGGALDHTHVLQSHFHSIIANNSTLNIAASGGQTTGRSTTQISIDSKDISHVHSGTTNTDGAHMHSIPNRSGNANVGSAGVVYLLRGGNTGQGGSTGVDLTGTNEAAHAHGFTTGGMSQNSTHSHGITEPNLGQGHSHAVPNHTHAVTDFTGAIGDKNSGRDGDGSLNTLGSNPPFLVVNYIISF